MLGELATSHLVVALNKVDLLPLEGREKLVSKARKRLGQTFALRRGERGRQRLEERYRPEKVAALWESIVEAEQKVRSARRNRSDA